MAHRAAALAAQIQAPTVPIRFSPEVAAALATPHGACKVVALESTIISHGMPYPANVECGKALEGIVRAAGAVPATIAVLDGVVHVGLDESKLELLGKLGPKCHKCSRRDLPLLIARKQNGATTVSGTILIAQMVGLEVMATGGVGGVHRRGEVSMDVSADLVEHGKTRILVVCAGVKSILDIPRTLEYLETQGVGVMAWRTDEFPAFFTRKSGVAAPLRLDTVEEGARYVAALRSLAYRGGGVLGVPLSKEEEADGAIVEAAIKQSLREIEEKKILGRDVTPYVLLRVSELTQGRSLKSNIALVKQNARIAADIAVKHHALRVAGHV